MPLWSIPSQVSFAKVLDEKTGSNSINDEFVLAFGIGCLVLALPK